MNPGRRRHGSIREQYPLLAVYGDETVRFLTHAEAIAATPEERIRSVWPYLVRTVLDFYDTLGARSQANYDPEDVISELYLTLMEKDAKWMPARGRYLSFAGRLIANELHAIRDRSTTVHSPRNSASRLKGYESEGELSDRKRKTYVDIRRVVSDHEGIDADEPGDVDGARAIAERREFSRRNRHKIKRGIAGLTPEESDSLGRAYGLFGRPEQGAPEIADSQGKTVEHVRKVIARAQRKFKRRLARGQSPPTSN